MSTEHDALKKSIEVALKLRDAMKKTSAQIEKAREEEKKRIPPK